MFDKRNQIKAIGRVAVKQFSFIVILQCLIFAGTAEAISITKIAKIQTPGILSLTADSKSSQGLIKWNAVKFVIDESTGVCEYSKDTVKAVGYSAQFNINNESGKYTFYKLIAGDAVQSDSLTIQVLLSGKVQKYLYSNNSISDYPIPVWIVLPTKYSSNSKFILTMCGISRNAIGMASYWSTFAEDNNYVVAAPDFNANDWSGSSYSQGNIFSGANGSGTLNKKERWTFNIVSEIHRELYTYCGLKDSTYELWGFSGGAQFVHRFAMFQKDNLVSRYTAASAGFYSVPDLSVSFPWGMKHSAFNLNQKDIIEYTKKNLVVMCGSEDTARDKEFKTDEKSDAQGLNRLQRAKYFYNSAKQINPDLKWKLIIIPAVAHEASKMSIAGGNYILNNPVRPKDINNEL